MKKSMSSNVRIAAAMAACTALFGCVVAPQAPQVKPQVTVKCTYPTIAALPETKEVQAKGGINIGLAPGTFNCTKGTSQKRVPDAPTLGEQLQLGLLMRQGDSSANWQLVETTITPTFSVVPDKIAFRVKINNQMPRVFRGAGTVVLYNFAGKNKSISQNEYAELSNIIVPPRSEAEVTIYGPSFTEMPDKATLGIFLYDVVIKTDQAGNILEKQNFEWYYNYQHQYKEEVGEVAKTRTWIRR